MRATALYVGKVGEEIQAVEMTAQIPGQADLFGGEQETPAQLQEDDSEGGKRDENCNSVRRK